MTIQSLNTILKVITDLKITLVDMDGLRNITEVLESVKKNNIPGGFLEAGVWRGGASIWARATMDYLNLKEPIYVCDSFAGLPMPSMKEDEGDDHFAYPELSVSLNTVKENFGYFPIEGEVRYVEGLFRDTMPKLKEEIKELSVLRIDADMYEGTMQVLENLYDKVSEGGFIIEDDYCLKGAKMAVDRFRYQRGITSRLIQVNDSIYYWQK